MRRILIVVVGVLVWAVTAAPALAHDHVRMTGNGSCVILAQNGGEKDVVLPHAESYDVGKQHPLHVNVHLGAPRTRNGVTVMWVLGPDSDANCDGYVNN